jgi:hypothetical protein
MHTQGTGQGLVRPASALRVAVARAFDDVHETAEHRADNLVNELIPAVEKHLEEFKGPQTPYNLMLAELNQEVQSRSSK